jgi:hypothetical protein
MTSLRIRFKLNPGRHGLPLGKMSKQTENIELFLRALAADLGIDDSKNLWIAGNFKNGSLDEVITLPIEVSADSVHDFNAAIEYLSKYTLKREVPSPLTAATIDRFAELRQCLDSDETIGIATFDVESANSRRFVYVDSLRLNAIGNSIEKETRYIGSVIGKTHEWNKGAEKPYIIIRDLVSSELIRCNYADSDYANVAKLFANKTAVVIIEGTISVNLITSKTEVLLATGFDVAPDFSEDDFNKFFGAAIGITGELTSEEFVAKGRMDEH